MKNTGKTPVPGPGSDWLETVKARAGRGNRILFAKDDALLHPLAELLQRESRRTVTLWALGLAEEAAAQLSQAHPGEARPENAVQAARAWAAGAIRMPLARQAILSCHALARELTAPGDIARCHAVAQGCSVVHTTGHAMGLPVYELTAVARERGLENCREAVERRSREYADRLLYWERHPEEYSGPWAAFLR